MLVIAAPGQGAQTPGFLSPWLDLPGFADRIAAWSDLAGCDLIRYGTIAGQDEITDTAVAQPLLVAAALAAAEALAGDLTQAGRQTGIAAASAAATSSGWATAVSVISSWPAVVPYRIRSQPARSDQAAMRSAKPGRSSQGDRKPGVCAP